MSVFDVNLRLMYYVTVCVSLYLYKKTYIFSVNISSMTLLVYCTLNTEQKMN